MGEAVTAAKISRARTEPVGRPGHKGFDRQF